MAIPIRVNAPSGQLRSGLWSPRASARDGNTDTEIAAPFRIRPPHAPGRHDAAHTSANGSAATNSSPGISTTPS